MVRFHVALFPQKTIAENTATYIKSMAYIGSVL